MTIADQVASPVLGDNQSRLVPRGADDRQLGAAILAAGGMATVVILALSLILPFSPPFRTSESGSEVTELLVARRELALGTVVLWCLMGMAFLSFAGYVASEFGRGRGRALAYTGALGATLGGVFLAVGQIMIYGLPLTDLASADPKVVRMFVDIGSLVMGTGKWGVALFCLGAALAGREAGAITRRLSDIGVVCCAIFVAGSIGPNFARGGVFEFGHVVEVLTTGPLTGWIFVLSLVLTREVRTNGRLAPAGPAEDPGTTTPLLSSYSSTLSS